jgi:hypothetical protein
MQVKGIQNAVALTLSLGSGLSVASNRMNFEVTKEKANFSTGVYTYDLEGNNDPGDRRTILRGTYTQVKDITRITTP